MTARLLLLLASVLAAASVVATGAAARTGLEGQKLGPLQALRTTTLQSGSAAALDLASSAWGGPTRTSSGERVTVYISDAYPEDAALHQRWADFLGSLLHGAELSSVTVYLTPLAELRGVCGRGALACYSPRDQVIVSLAEDLPGAATAESVLAHEYGHHVANNRLNPPWDAADWGTKRWASYVGVCAGAAGGTLFPGDEGTGYARNPGEAFAETYRVLNERRLDRPESAWDVVDQDLFPDATALALLQQDIVAPWTSASALARTGTLPRTRARSFSVSTPLDGSLTARVRARAGARLTLAVADGTGTVLARSASGSVQTTVCGQRSLVFRVSGAKRGAFTLRISRP